MAQRRLLQHYRRFTPNIQSTGKALLAAPRHGTLDPRKMRGHLSMSSRHNAIASASICVALGAGAFLCARAFSTSNGSTSSISSTRRSHKALSAAGSKDGVPETSRSQDDASRGKDAATPAPTKQPCGGCDCGLMEPGPLEGTMHAYERHIIICR